MLLNKRLLQGYVAGRKAKQTAADEYFPHAVDLTKRKPKKIKKVF